MVIQFCQLPFYMGLCFTFQTNSLIIGKIFILYRTIFKNRKYGSWASNLNFVEISSCYNPVAGHQIAKNVCTCHNSTVAVYKIVQWWPNLNRGETETIFASNLIAMEKPLVERSHEYWITWLFWKCMEVVTTWTTVAYAYLYIVHQLEMG